MHAIISAGGDPPDPRWTPELDGDLFIAADSGLSHFVALGRRADLIIGDMDSVDPAQLAAAVEHGSHIERHPGDKDATDLELALHAAVKAGAQRVTVIGAGGGRLDHFAANLALLTAPDWKLVDVVAFIGAARVTVVRSSAEVTGVLGSIVTLLAATVPARGVTTTGMRWSLNDATLNPGSTHGVSNELVATRATVSITTGALLAIQPMGGQ